MHQLSYVRLDHTDISIWLNVSSLLNPENPLGFHLGQGASFTYVSGNEYEDVAAAWDWNLIPGITTDYAATRLSCSTTQQTGKSVFVGGASDGRIGLAAMEYINPLTKNLTYRKAWFFFDNDIQHVMVSGVNSTTSADVYSVLDQKRANGPVYVDGEEVLPENVPVLGPRNFTEARSLWHGQIGYIFDRASLLSKTDGNTGMHHLSVSVTTRTGNWSDIGVSTVPGKEVKMFSAWIQHEPPVTKLASSLLPITNLTSSLPPTAYSIYPGTKSHQEFKSKAKEQRIRTVQNDDIASAAKNSQGVAMVVFWKPDGGKVEFSSVSIESNRGAIIIFDTSTGSVTVADPTQSLESVTLTFARLGGESRRQENGTSKPENVVIVKVALKADGEAGQSVKLTLNGW